MFKNIFKTVILSIIFIGFAKAEPVNLKGTTKGIDVHLTSENSLTVGNNDFFISLSRNGKIIKDAKVKIKFFMPEMPGMPYMEYKSKAKLVGDKYKAMINFGMNGTWQYKLRFKTKDEKTYKLRGNMIL